MCRCQPAVHQSKLNSCLQSHHSDRGLALPRTHTAPFRLNFSCKAHDSTTKGRGAFFGIDGRAKFSKLHPACTAEPLGASPNTSLHRRHNSQCTAMAAHCSDAPAPLGAPCGLQINVTPSTGEGLQNASNTVGYRSGQTHPKSATAQIDAHASPQSEAAEQGAQGSGLLSSVMPTCTNPASTQCAPASQSHGECSGHSVAATQACGGSTQPHREQQVTNSSDQEAMQKSGDCAEASIAATQSCGATAQNELQVSQGSHCNTHRSSGDGIKDKVAATQELGAPAQPRCKQHVSNRSRVAHNTLSMQPAMDSTETRPTTETHQEVHEDTVRLLLDGKSLTPVICNEKSSSAPVGNKCGQVELQDRSFFSSSSSGGSPPKLAMNAQVTQTALLSCGERFVECSSHSQPIHGYTNQIHTADSADVIPDSEQHSSQQPQNLQSQAFDGPCGQRIFADSEVMAIGSQSTCDELKVVNNSKTRVCPGTSAQADASDECKLNCRGLCTSSELQGQKEGVCLDATEASMHTKAADVWALNSQPLCGAQCDGGEPSALIPGESSVQMESSRASGPRHTLMQADQSYASPHTSSLVQVAGPNPLRAQETSAKTEPCLALVASDSHTHAAVPDVLALQEMPLDPKASNAEVPSKTLKHVGHPKASTPRGILAQMKKNSIAAPEALTSCQSMSDSKLRHNNEPSEQPPIWTLGLVAAGPTSSMKQPQSAEKQAPLLAAPEEAHIKQSTTNSAFSTSAKLSQRMDQHPTAATTVQPNEARLRHLEATGVTLTSAAAPVKQCQSMGQPEPAVPSAGAAFIELDANGTALQSAVKQYHTSKQQASVASAAHVALLNLEHRGTALLSAIKGPESTEQKHSAPTLTELNPPASTSENTKQNLAATALHNAQEKSPVAISTKINENPLSQEGALERTEQKQPAANSTNILLVERETRPTAGSFLANDTIDHDDLLKAKDCISRPQIDSLVVPDIADTLPFPPSRQGLLITQQLAGYSKSPAGKCTMANLGDTTATPLPVGLVSHKEQQDTPQDGYGCPQIIGIKKGLLLGKKEQVLDKHNSVIGKADVQEVCCMESQPRAVRTAKSHVPCLKRDRLHTLQIVDPARSSAAAAAADCDDGRQETQSFQASKSAHASSSQATHEQPFAADRCTGERLQIKEVPNLVPGAHEALAKHHCKGTILCSTFQNARTLAANSSADAEQKEVLRNAGNAVHRRAAAQDLHWRDAVRVQGVPTSAAARYNHKGHQGSPITKYQQSCTLSNKHVRTSVLSPKNGSEKSKATHSSMLSVQSCIASRTRSKARACAKSYPSKSDMPKTRFIEIPKLDKGGNNNPVELEDSHAQAGPGCTPNHKKKAERRSIKQPVPCTPQDAGFHVVQMHQLLVSKAKNSIPGNKHKAKRKPTARAERLHSYEGQESEHAVQQAKLAPPSLANVAMSNTKQCATAKRRLNWECPRDKQTDVNAGKEHSPGRRHSCTRASIAGRAEQIPEKTSTVQWMCSAVLSGGSGCQPLCRPSAQESLKLELTDKAAGVCQSNGRPSGPSKSVVDKAGNPSQVQHSTGLWYTYSSPCRAHGSQPIFTHMHVVAVGGQQSCEMTDKQHKNCKQNLCKSLKHAKDVAHAKMQCSKESMPCAKQGIRLARGLHTSKKPGMSSGGFTDVQRLGLLPREQCLQSCMRQTCAQGQMELRQVKQFSADCPVLVRGCRKPQPPQLQRPKECSRGTSSRRVLEMCARHTNQALPKPRVLKRARLASHVLRPAPPLYRRCKQRCTQTLQKEKQVQWGNTQPDVSKLGVHADEDPGLQGIGSSAVIGLQQRAECILFEQANSESAGKREVQISAVQWGLSEGYPDEGDRRGRMKGCCSTSSTAKIIADQVLPRRKGTAPVCKRHLCLDIKSTPSAQENTQGLKEHAPCKEVKAVQGRINYPNGYCEHVADACTGPWENSECSKQEITGPDGSPVALAKALQARKGGGSSTLTMNVLPRPLESNSKVVGKRMQPGAQLHLEQQPLYDREQHIKPQEPMDRHVSHNTAGGSVQWQPTRFRVPVANQQRTEAYSRATASQKTRSDAFDLQPLAPSTGPAGAWHAGTDSSRPEEHHASLPPHQPFRLVREGCCVRPASGRQAGHFESIDPASTSSQIGQTRSSAKSPMKHQQLYQSRSCEPAHAITGCQLGQNGIGEPGCTFPACPHNTTQGLAAAVPVMVVPQQIVRSTQQLSVRAQNELHASAPVLSSRNKCIMNLITISKHSPAWRKQRHNAQVPATGGEAYDVGAAHQHHQMPPALIPVESASTDLDLAEALEAPAELLKNMSSGVHQAIKHSKNHILPATSASKEASMQLQTTKPIAIAQQHTTDFFSNMPSNSASQALPCGQATPAQTVAPTASVCCNGHQFPPWVKAQTPEKAWLASKPPTHTVDCALSRIEPSDLCQSQPRKKLHALPALSANTFEVHAAAQKPEQQPSKKQCQSVTSTMADTLPETVCGPGKPPDSRALQDEYLHCAAPSSHVHVAEISKRRQQQGQTSMQVYDMCAKVNQVPEVTNMQSHSWHGSATNPFSTPKKQSNIAREPAYDMETPASELLMVDLSPPSATPQPRCASKSPRPATSLFRTQLVQKQVGTTQMEEPLAYISPPDIQLPRPGLHCSSMGSTLHKQPTMLRCSSHLDTLRESRQDGTVVLQTSDGLSTLPSSGSLLAQPPNSKWKSMNSKSNGLMSSCWSQRSTSLEQGQHPGPKSDTQWCELSRHQHGLLTSGQGSKTLLGTNAGIFVQNPTQDDLGGLNRDCASLSQTPIGKDKVDTGSMHHQDGMPLDVSHQTSIDKKLLCGAEAAKSQQESSLGALHMRSSKHAHGLAPQASGHNASESRSDVVSRNILGKQETPFHSDVEVPCKIFTGSKDAPSITPGLAAQRSRCIQKAPNKARVFVGVSVNGSTYLSRTQSDWSIQQRPDSAEQGSISLAAAGKTIRASPGQAFPSMQGCAATAQAGIHTSPTKHGIHRLRSHKKVSSNNELAARPSMKQKLPPLRGHNSQDGSEQSESKARDSKGAHEGKSLRAVLQAALNGSPLAQSSQKTFSSAPHKESLDQLLEFSDATDPELADAFKEVCRLERQYLARKQTSISLPASPPKALSHGAQSQSSQHDYMSTPLLVKQSQLLSSLVAGGGTDLQTSSINVSLQDSLIVSADTLQWCQAGQSTFRSHVPDVSHSNTALVPDLSLMTAGTSGQQSPAERRAVRGPTSSLGASCSRPPRQPLPRLHSAPAFRKATNRKEEPMQRASETGRSGSCMTSFGEAPTVNLDDRMGGAVEDRVRDAEGKRYKDIASSKRYNDLAMIQKSVHSLHHMRCDWHVHVYM
jgi:hypothetical protein